MTISVQGEYSPQRRMYEMYDGATSGTRGLAVSRVKSRFNELGIGSNNIPGRGYGLELLLNKLFSHPFQAGEYVNNTAMG